MVETQFLSEFLSSEEVESVLDQISSLNRPCQEQWQNHPQINQFIGLGGQPTPVMLEKYPPYLVSKTQTLTEVFETSFGWIFDRVQALFDYEIGVDHASFQHMTHPWGIHSDNWFTGNDTTRRHDATCVLSLSPATHAKTVVFDQTSIPGSHNFDTKHMILVNNPIPLEEWHQELESMANSSWREYLSVDEHQPGIQSLGSLTVFDRSRWHSANNWHRYEDEKKIIDILTYRK